VPAGNATLDLFGQDHLPEGMKYQADFLSAEEEKALLREAESLPFGEFEFHGFTGKRRTVSFGWRYDFNGGGLTKTDDMPQFLSGLRARAEAFAENPPGGFQQVLVTEYPPGAGIGWHKDRSVFGDVVGISLGSSCTFRMRRRLGHRFGGSPSTRSRVLFTSCAALSRTEWQHSIPRVEALRYSITFRNVLDGTS